MWYKLKFGIEGTKKTIKPIYVEIQSKNHKKPQKTEERMADLAVEIGLLIAVRNKHPLNDDAYLCGVDYYSESRKPRAGCYIAVINNNNVTII